jgi:hypothetical protein
MELAASTLTQLTEKNLKAVTKKGRSGTLSSVLFPHLMKNAELILVVSFSVPYKKSILCLASVTMKSICSSGSMS